ncbi:DUF2231 domain-containing protein [Rummeliibacillus sp. NPDC094406]|uniref:DUF2231 domain-containing protein n=1 Tax=Rummeliibacillus sp. NPDC094406 TaxID=3364511 RepID=UPI003803846A
MPLHPLIVHFPIAILILGAVIEIVNVFTKKETLNRFGTLLIIIGVLSGFVALATGDGAEHFAYQNWGRGLHDQIELHSLLADVSMFTFGALAIVKILFRHSIFKWNVLQSKALKGGFATVLIILLSIAGTVSLAVTGHLGGKIVYGNHSTTSVTDSNASHQDSDE